MDPNSAANYHGSRSQSEEASDSHLDQLEETPWTEHTGEDEGEMNFGTSSADSEEAMQEFFDQFLDTEEGDDDDDDEYHDAEEGEIGDVIDGDTATEVEAVRDTEALIRARRVRILRLLANAELGRIFLTNTEEDDEDDDNDPRFRRRRRRSKPDPNRFPKVPSDAGIALMNSGNFGTSELRGSGRTSMRKQLAQRILDRELGVGSRAVQKANQRLMAQGMIPSSKADMLIHYDAPVYSGQFSDDGNFFFSCVKDFKVRMYNTSNPYKWKYYKTVEYPFGQWTLTDATLTPDNKYLAYASIQPKVCLAPTDPNDLGDPYTLDLSDNGTRGRTGGFRSRHGSFGIWSIRFSGDGRELVAGTSANSIVVYDVEARRSVLEIPGHEDDVNAVCFGDKSSPHILYSGSDDTTLKVWDRRSMGDSREAGAFVGSTEGVTYIDSKGDGRYILSNSKDQTMKLWDLRMVMTTARFAQIDVSSYTTGFDYRWGDYDEDDYKPHPFDNSLVTFRSHRVLRTLIRCHFSPPGSTNSRYVYSGSEDGKVYIYNMDATLAGTIDVLEASRGSRPYRFTPSNYAHHDDEQQANWKTCVRDASWHPNAPIIAGKLAPITDNICGTCSLILASSWNGYGFSTGTVTVHSWNDGADDDEAEPQMGVNVNDKLEVDSIIPSQLRSRYRRVTLDQELE